VTFTEWRESNDEGVRVVGLNLRVTFTSIDGSISQRKILTNDPDLKGQVIDRFDYIDFESKLGKLLIDKKVDDTFKFGNTEYRIININ
jgi:transcription elongation GreA/GreB family factor